MSVDIKSATKEQCNSSLPVATMYFKELMLRDCGLGKEGISAIFSGLTKFPALTTLDVAFGDGGAVLMAELVNHTSLEVLDISSCGIGEEGIVAIAAALKAQKALSLFSWTGHQPTF